MKSLKKYNLRFQFSELKEIIPNDSNFLTYIWLRVPHIDLRIKC